MKVNQKNLLQLDKRSAEEGRDMADISATTCPPSRQNHPAGPSKGAVVEEGNMEPNESDVALPARQTKESELSDNRLHKKQEATAPVVKEKPSDTELNSSKKVKADTDEVYDSSKNFFSSFVSKAKRAISKLSTEEHVLTTLTAEQNPSERKVKQTHEMKRCFDAIAQAKQVSFNLGGQLQFGLSAEVRVRWELPSLDSRLLATGMSRNTAHVQKVVDCIKTCHEAQGHRQVPQEHFTEEEELPVEHIKCSACDNGESEEENDILLCDGEGCNRCYHVHCVPFRSDLDVQALLDDEESGWLCPACDAKYDIFWHLSETRDMNYNSLLAMQAEDVFAGSDMYMAGASSGGPEKENIDKGTILHADLPSSDEEDSDFADSDLEEAQADAGECEAGPSAPVEEPQEVSGADSDDDTGGESVEDEEDEDGGNSSDEYIDDDDDASLDIREDNGDAQGQAGPTGPRVDAGENVGEVLSGKRRRTQVDYEVLNSYLFGGEQDEDQEDAEYAVDAYADDSDDEIRNRKAAKRPKNPKQGAGRR